MIELSQRHSRGEEFEVMVCDPRKADEVAAAAKAIGDLFQGHLDCLVNNAGYIGGVGGPKLTDPSLVNVWNESLETNLTGAMLLSRACIFMRRTQQSRTRGGCILYISSIRAIMSEADNEPYSASKAGLIGLMRAMSASLADDGVRCSAISLGWINVAHECNKDETGQTGASALGKDEHAWRRLVASGKLRAFCK